MTKLVNVSIKGTLTLEEDVDVKDQDLVVAGSIRIDVETIEEVAEAETEEAADVMVAEMVDLKKY